MASGFSLITRLLIAPAIFFSVIAAAGAATPDPLTSLQSIHELTNAQAAEGLPAWFEATVTYSDAQRRDLFVQDGPAGIYVWENTPPALAPGDRVRIKGITASSFRPYIYASEITLLGHGTLPKPQPADFDSLVRAQFDSVLVTMRGIVRAANPGAQRETDAPGGSLILLTDGGYVTAVVHNGSASDMEKLLDAEVSVTGVAGGSFDGKKQQTGAALHVFSLQDIEVVKPAARSPWSLPVTPMDEVLGSYHVQNQTGRVLVAGVVTYYEPGTALVLQSGTKSLWIATRSFAPLRLGDWAEATGFPSADYDFLDLSTSEIRDLGRNSGVNPQPVTWRQLTSNKHLFDLVAIEGEVAVEAREAAQDEYVLASGGYKFSAILRHPAHAQTNTLAPMKSIPLGSRIRVTGICVPDNPHLSHGNGDFNILLRSPDDITVLAGPSQFNARNGVLVAGCLLVIVLALGMRAWYLERKSRRQIGSLAYVEQRRGRILEDINHSKPLAGILERISELVSVRLNGAPCWCQITKGAMLGNRPAQPDSSLRIVKQSIAARSGPALGAIYAAFDARTKSSPIEKEALKMAAELATLAIETSRLYSDLVHRSEFDLLTDIHNRFSFEKQIETAIEAARQSAGIFGLLYIDLNDFKLVNDNFGHHTGDLYLQEAAMRMKGQLRPGDVLARLGGDEFGVILPDVRDRADVEEITLRLEHCFEKSFSWDDCSVRGTASIGIAMYPADGITRDGLLRAADAAMYITKQTRRQAGVTASDQPVR